VSLNNIYTVGHKTWHFAFVYIFAIIIDRFSKFFDWHTLQKICNIVIIIYPTTQ